MGRDVAVQWGATSRQQSFWDMRAACNFIGGGTGSALLWWAALGLIAGKQYFAPALVGLMFVSMGLFMVWLEIGKPWRALNLFYRPQTSWMSREGIVALPLLAAAAFSVLADAGIRLPVPLPAPHIPAALTAMLGLLFLYCQSAILHTARGIPAWREPRVVPLIASSGLTEGLGIYLLITAALGSVSIAMMVVAIMLVGVRALLWHGYIAALTRSAAPEPTMAALAGVRAVFLVIGHALPVILLALAWIWPGNAATFSALAGVAATLGGWLLKVTLLTKAAYIPEYAVPAAPVRGRPGHSTIHKE